jgi:hypothetical protein
MSTKATARPCLPTPASRACLTIRHELPGNNQFIFRRRRIISASAENRGNSCQRKHSAPGTRLGQSCVSQTSQLKTRIVSVARIRLNPWKTVRPFKGICDDISEFESYMPSHAVRSLSDIRYRISPEQTLTNANGLCGQNSAWILGIRASFQRDNLRRRF